MALRKFLFFVDQLSTSSITFSSEKEKVAILQTFLVQESDEDGSIRQPQISKFIQKQTLSVQVLNEA